MLHAALRDDARYYCLDSTYVVSGSVQLSLRRNPISRTFGTVVNLCALVGVCVCHRMFCLDVFGSLAVLGGRFSQLDTWDIC